MGFTKRARLLTISVFVAVLLMCLCSFSLLPSCHRGIVVESYKISNVSCIRSSLLSLVSKKVIVRSVYFDDRPRDGHSNASVFMVEAFRNSLGEGVIVGCKIGKHYGKFVSVRLVRNVRWIHRTFPKITHDMFMVDCFDVPVKNGSKAFLLFNSRVNGIKCIESERPLLVPAPRIALGLDMKVLVCVATARFVSEEHRLTRDDQIYHWLNYQKAIGVDHVHFTAQPSFLSHGSLQNDVMRKAILDNFVSFEFWEPWLNENDTYNGHSQNLAFEDCVYRYRGTYDYIVICDTDDFFVPRVPGQKNFRYYIQKWCKYTACFFDWVDRYPDCGLKWEELGEDGNLTAILKSEKEGYRKNFKSLYKSSKVLDAGTHKPMRLMHLLPSYYVPYHFAYFAHIRHGRLPEKNVC